MNLRTKEELTACRMLRMTWDRSCVKWEAMRRTKVAPNQYRCEKCKEVFKLREVQVDHIVPCVPVTGWDNLQMFAFRLYCPAGQLQVLCQDNCHQGKSNRENAARKKGKKK
jgi:hypothetical protein